MAASATNKSSLPSIATPSKFETRDSESRLAPIADNNANIPTSDAVSNLNVNSESSANQNTKIQESLAQLKSSSKIGGASTISSSDTKLYHPDPNTGRPSTNGAEIDGGGNTAKGFPGALAGTVNTVVGKPKFPIGKDETTEVRKGGGLSSSYGRLPKANTVLRELEKEKPNVKILLTLQDFELGVQIGRGAFASVHLVKPRPNGVKQLNIVYKPPESSNHDLSTRPLAMKALRKHQIVSTKQARHVLHEKKILQTLSSSGDTRSRFVVEMIATFQDPRHLYMLMEYVPGGDLWSHIRRYGRFLEDEAKFYAAEIVMGVEFIHSKDVIFRDLKPENILVTKEGHLKITDFGFAKPFPCNPYNTVPSSKSASENNTANFTTALTFCGTPAYMAPEIILRQPYTNSVDWWSVGVVCYELLAGYTPFHDSTPLKIYDRVLCQDGFRWSSQIKGNSQSFISGLLGREFQSRLGSHGGGSEVRAHPWLEGMDWDILKKGKLAPPFKPELQSEDDTAYFDVGNEPGHGTSVLEMQMGRAKVEDTDGIYDEQFKGF